MCGVERRGGRKYEGKEGKEGRKKREKNGGRKREYSKKEMAQVEKYCSKF